MDERVDAFRVWLRDHRRMAAQSVRLYSSDVSTFLASGMVPNDWIATGGKPGRARGRKYSLRAWFIFLGVENKDFGVIRQNTDPPIYATPDAVLSLLEIVRKSYSEREYMALMLMYGCGLRLGELQALRLGNINFEARMIRVRGKGSKVRHVTMMEPLVEPLKHWINEGRTSHLREKTGDALFMGNRGGFYDGEIPCRAMTEALESAGLGKVHCRPLHWLRHMCATHLYEAGWSIAQVQALLGHDHITTTMLYIHVSTKKMNEMIRVHPLASINDNPRFEVIKVAS
jgi:site-specific recombinase XerD